MLPDLQELFNISHDLLCIVNTEGTILYLNQSFKSFFQQEDDTTKGVSITQIVKPTETNAFEDLFKKCTILGRPFEGRISCTMPDESVVPIHWKVSESKQGHYFLAGEPAKSLAWDEQDPTALSAGFNHLNKTLEGGQRYWRLTDSFAAKIKEMLDEQVNKYELISKNVSDIICLHEPQQAIYVFVSPSVQDLTGFLPEEILGRTPYDFFHPDDVPMLEPDHKRSQSGEAPSPKSKLVYRFRLKNGGYRWMESVSKPIFNEAGEVILILSSTRDVHDRVLAEKERQTYFDYHRILANRIPNGAVFLIDDQANYLIAEGEELAKIGRTSKDYVGRNALELFDQRGSREIKPQFEKLLKGNSVRHSYQNFGSYYSLVGEPYYNDEGKLIGAILLVQNITDTKRQEDKLKKAIYELNFQKSALDLTALVSITDRDGVITYVNEKLCQVSGYTREEFLGSTHKILDSGQHDGDFWQHMWENILNGEVWHQEVCNKTKDNKIFWADTYIVPFRSAQGDITKFVTIRFDVTRRKAVEQDLKSKNYELDNFVYHTSHDLRAPLTSIMGLVNIIMLEDRPEQIKHYNKLIHDSVRKLDEFIKSILNYSRSNNSEEKAEPVDFVHIIEECKQELRYLKNFNLIDIQYTINSAETFFSDPIRLTIIFKNIISNAIKYLKANDNGSFLDIKVNVGPEAGVLEFKDNGQGIPKEYISRIFEMFYRANEASDGSGLGLYIVKQTIDKLGGKIKINSTMNRGTEITITLPNKKAKALAKEEHLIK